jgi:hypothetical protein
MVLVLAGGASATMVARGEDAPGTTGSTTTEATTAVETATTPKPPLIDMARVRALRKAVVFHRTAAWRWETTSFVPLATTRYAERHTKSTRRLQGLVLWWSFVHFGAKKYALHPPHEAAWWCIHRFEGAWDDHGAPYYGGLQMDLGFQRHYGSRLLNAKGTADNWSPLEQMWVAEQAYKSGRGFFPWPNTARACGLI